MMARPEVIFLSHRIPYPPDKGDKIRSWRILQYLCARYRVHLACFVDDKIDLQHTKYLGSLCQSAVFAPLNPAMARLRSFGGFLNGKPLSFQYYDDRRMRAAIDEMRARPLVAEIAFSSTMAPYIETAKPGRRRIVDFCDADSVKWRQYAGEESGLMRFVYDREGIKLAAAETAIANWADHSFAISDIEAEIFNGDAGLRRKVDWWTNGVDANYFDPAAQFSPINEAADIVFVGAMDYRANIDAVRYFCDAVWPLIVAQQSTATLAIVGANPARSIRQLGARAGICVTGRVEDVRPWLAQSSVAIAPLRIARGIQNKVLEAMAMAKPVIATACAAAGIQCRPGKDIVLAEEPGAFAKAVCDLLDDETMRAKLGAAARARVLNDYDWNTTLKRFAAALPDVKAHD